MYDGPAAPHAVRASPSTPSHRAPLPADCLRYFADYGPTYVEWINDSACNVLFADAPTAKRAVVGLGKPLPPEEMPDLAGEGGEAG